MRKTIGLFIALTTSSIGFGQNFYSEFQKNIKSNDTIKQLETLTAWEKANPKDPELFTCFFNYYFRKSKDELILLTTQKPNGVVFELKDSLNQTAGYLGSQIDFNQIEFQKGIDKINEGMQLFPNRLDMRFGKIYAFGQIKDWRNFTNEIIVTVQYSKTNNNEWTWTNNEKRADGKEFFLSSLQDYQLQLYNIGDDNLLIDMRNIANEILKYYPDHIESLSNLSVTYLLKGEYDKGIEPLLKAEKLDPKDYIVLSNIAQGYKLKGDKKKAIEYYEKVIEYGDADTKAYAKDQIKELKK
jgi:tetratricopeptide (TPR) repeat protein